MLQEVRFFADEGMTLYPAFGPSFDLGKKQEEAA